MAARGRPLRLGRPLHMEPLRISEEWVKNASSRSFFGGKSHVRGRPACGSSRALCARFRPAVAPVIHARVHSIEKSERPDEDDECKYQHAKQPQHLLDYLVSIERLLSSSGFRRGPRLGYRSLKKKRPRSSVSPASSSADSFIPDGRSKEDSFSELLHHGTSDRPEWEV